MANCSFCGKAIEKGTGKIFVKKDGKILNFHNTKCEKNMLKLGRKARNLKWTIFFEKQEMPVASEKRVAKRKAQEKKKVEVKKEQPAKNKITKK